MSPARRRWLLACACGLLLGAAAEAREPGGLALRGHKHHQLLFFMGGLKSLAAIVLIKIKIVLAVAAIVAVTVFTIKYLLGTTALPDLPGLLYKGNVMPPPPQHPPLPPPYLHEEPVYGYGDHQLIDHVYNSWDQNGHEKYGNDWSNVGNGGRSFQDITTMDPNFAEMLSENYFDRRKRKVKRKNYFNWNHM